MAYCIYTAASVAVQDVNAGDVIAAHKMQTLLRALRAGITTCPMLQRSLDIIINNLKAHTVGSQTLFDANSPSTSLYPDQASIFPPSQATDTWQPLQFATSYPTLGDGQSTLAPPLAAGGFLPAFPYTDGPFDPLNGTVTEALDLASFSFLDCFPENRIDDTQSDWFTS